MIKNLIDALKSDLKVHMSKNIVYKDDVYDLSNYKFNYSQNELKILEKHKAKQELIEKVRNDYKSGISITDIEEKYDLHFKTVKKYLTYDSVRICTIKKTELDNYSAIVYDLIKKDLNFHQIYTEKNMDIVRHMRISLNKSK